MVSANSVERRPNSDPEQDAQDEPRLSLWVRLVPLLALIAVGAGLWFVFGLERFADPAALHRHHAQLAALVEANAALSGIGFMLAYALATAFSLPIASLLTLVGGFLFGTLLATLYVVVGATLGATALFLAARSALGNVLRARTGSSLGRMRAGIRKDAFSYLLVLRLIPLFPFWLVNLVPAFLGVSLRTYVIATAIGIIPASFVYASAGNGLGAVLAAGRSPDLGLILKPEILTPLLGLALLALLPVVYRRWKAHKDRGRSQT